MQLWIRWALGGGFGGRVDVRVLCLLLRSLLPKTVSCLFKLVSPIWGKQNGLTVPECSHLWSSHVLSEVGHASLLPALLNGPFGVLVSKAE